MFRYYWNPMIVALGLQQRELVGEQVAEVGRLRSLYRRPSVNDLFAPVLARHLGATLLTGDRHLREAAVKEQVDVHGTLWVLDEMVRHEIVLAVHVADVLRRMLRFIADVYWTKRIHSALGYLTPVAFEATWLQERRV